MQIPFTFLASLFSGLLLGQSLLPNSPSIRPDAIAVPPGSAPCLVVSATANNALCNGDNSGSVNATATGGSGNYQFSWQGCSGGPFYNTALVTDLIAGCYQVTVTDGNGCSGTASVQVFEPSAFRFTVTVDSATCFGVANGSASISAKGGTPGYRYLWDNGQTTQTANGFAAGVHLVTVTDTLGCRAVTTFEVFQPAPLALDSSSIRPPVCFGESNGAITVLGQGGTGVLSYAWSNLQQLPTATGLAAGLYTVSIRDANNCLFVHQVNLPEPALLELLFDQLSDEKCPGACNGTAHIRIAGGTGPYLLVWQGIVVPTQDTLANKLCPDRYPIKATDANGCAVADTFDIAPGIAPGIVFDSLAPSCAGTADGTLKITVLNGNPPYRYAWSNGSTGDELKGLACGIYRVTITDVFDCVYEDSVALSCPPPLVLDTIEVQQPRCTGETNGSIRVRASGGTGTLQYVWSDPNAQISPTASSLAAGIYTVTIRDDKGCALLVSDTITDPLPIRVLLQTTDARCFGSNDGNIVAIVGGGTYPYTYDWSNGDLDSIAAPLAPGLFSLVVMDASGCVAPLVSAAISGPAAPLEVQVLQMKRACEGANDGQAEVFASGGNAGLYTYAWSNMATTKTIDDLAPGLYTVTVQDAKNCSDTASVKIVQLKKLKIKLASSMPTCFDKNDGSAGVVGFEGGTGDSLRYTYQWEVAPNVNGPFLSGLKGGQTYYVTVTDTENCKAMDSIPVANGPRVIPMIQVEQVRCFGEANGTATVVSVQAAHPIAAYLWSTQDTARSITDLVPGTYSLIVEDVTGCKGMDTISITHPPPLVAQLNVVTALRCAGDRSGVISAAISGGTPTYRLQWSNQDTTSVITQLGQGSYSVTITDQKGCTEQQQIDMPTPDSLDLRVVMTPPRCFNDDNGRLTLSVSGGNGPYRYSIDGGAFGGSAVFFRLKAGTYTTRVLDANGCVSSLVNILENPLPLEVTLGGDTTVTPGTQLTLTPDISNAFGMVSYQWQLAPLDVLNCPDPPICTEIEVAPYRDTWYNVTITDENGCKGAAAIRIGVEKRREVFVPTGFSPNDDGANDRMVIHGSNVQIKTIRSLSVYDRWGELVYQDAEIPVNDPDRGWDGTFRGTPCDPGVFVWKMDIEFIDGYLETLSGNITLIR